MYILEPSKEKSKETKYPSEKVEKRPSTKDFQDKDKEKTSKLDSSSINQKSSKQQNPSKKDSNKQPSESSGKRKEDKEKTAWENKFRYRESDDSEFFVHFFIENVYLSPNRKIDEFLSSVRDRINKAGQCEFVQIAFYYEKEVKLSIGMKYDQDALDILNHKRMILLYNREQKLYETKPVIGKSFELYCLAKKSGDFNRPRSRSKNEKNYEKKRNYSDSRSKSRSKRKRNPSDDSRKKDKAHHNFVRRSNYEKNLMKNMEKNFRSKSGSRSSMRNR